MSARRRLATPALLLLSALALGGCVVTGAKLTVAVSEKNGASELPVSSPPDFDRDKPDPVAGCLPVGTPCP